MLLWSTKNLTFSYNGSWTRNNRSAFHWLPWIRQPVQRYNRQYFSHHRAAEVRDQCVVWIPVLPGQTNGRPIPDGVYLAPFASYYGYHFKNNVDVLHTVLDSAIALKGNFYILNVGVELGYQFVFWKGWHSISSLLGRLSVLWRGCDVTGNVNLAQLQEITRIYTIN